MAAFDYKKEFKDLYMPKNKPMIIEVPSINFAAVEGRGNPNDEEGEYKSALELLYSISYTIKMSYKGVRTIDGYFEYVVPPLEGLWWMADGSTGVDYNNKAGFQWISMIRVPEFVTEEVFAWAAKEVENKKKINTQGVKFFTYNEGLCVQCMHFGSYDDEPVTVNKMEAYINENGYVNDFSDIRRHHEIYLGDPRRTVPEKLKTVIRHPVKSHKD